MTDAPEIPVRDLYRVSEVQERLAFSRSSIRTLMEKGAFGPIVRHGRAVRISRVGLERWLEQQTGSTQQAS